MSSPILRLTLKQTILGTGSSLEITSYWARTASPWIYQPQRPTPSEGVSIPIAATNDAACPLRSLRHLFTKYPAKGNTPLFQVSGGVSRQHVTATLRRMLLDVGIKGKFSAHSFRRGAATWTEIRGIPGDKIRALGRWRSDSYLLYIDRGPDRILAYSRKFKGTQ